MAIFYPAWDEIWNSRIEPPYEGEGALLKLLAALDDTYEVYFQTHINIAHPDIVLIRRGYGVLIIEVKDWNLDRYAFKPTGDEFGCLTEKAGGHEILNPFQQAIGYKSEFYNLFCPALIIETHKNKKVWGIIQTAVYFHTASSEQVDGLFGDAPFAENKYKYRYWVNGSDILGDIQAMFRQPGWYFSEEIYKQVHSVLTPSQEWQEQGEPVSLSEKQLEFAQSIDGKKQKIKGAAGSGKTLVLAQRAINCCKRTGQPVLILSYNITLRNYIRDKISQMSRDEGWSGADKNRYFVRFHVYSFMKQMCDNQDIPLKFNFDAFAEDDSCDQYMDQMIRELRSRKDQIRNKYHSILIDEVQDFRYEWLTAIKDLFLEEGGEFVLFGDEKQNIYDRALDENRLPRTPVPGRWALLNECFRLTQQNGELAFAFQKAFFQDKYEPSEMEYTQMRMDAFNAREEQRYYEIPNDSRCIAALYDIIEHFRNDGEPISPNDICILSEKHEVLMWIEYYLRTQMHIQTNIISETKEEYDAIVSTCPPEWPEKAKRKKCKRALDEIRRNKKFGLQMNPGVMKLCTTHSFKGWEINTIVLWIDSESKNDELLYTAVTRAKKNLIVVNCGNDRYRDFFRSHITKKYEMTPPVLIPPPVNLMDIPPVAAELPSDVDFSGRHPF